MSTYEVTMPDGRVYEVTAPEGATREQIVDIVRGKQYDEAIEALFVSAPESEPEPEETTLIGNIFRGVGAGAVNTLEMAALGAITPLGEETESSARDVIKSVADFVRPRLANPEEVSATLAQGIGSILGFAPALLAGPAAGLVATGLSASAGAGEASERARAKDATQEQRNVAARLGVIPGLFDVLPLGRFARAAGVDIGDVPVIGDMINKLGPEAVDGMLSRVQRAGISGGIEGAQEAAQSIAQNLIEQGYSPETPTFGGTLEEGLIGGGAGAIFQGLLDLAVGRRQRGPSAPTAPEEQLALPAPEEQLALPAPGAGISGILTDQRQSVDPDTGAILGRDETGAILGRDETGLSRSDIAVQELQAVIDESRANISRLSESARDLPFTPAQEDSGASTMGRGNDPVFAPVDAELDRIRAAQEEIDNIRNRPEEFRDASLAKVGSARSGTRKVFTCTRCRSGVT
jgi:hypothetical protein